MVIYTDHAALQYLMMKPDSKLRLIIQALLLQEFDIEIEIKDKKGSKNVVANHLSCLENEDANDTSKENMKAFPDE